MNPATIPDPGIEVERWAWQTIQILDDRSVLITNDLLSVSECDAGEVVQRRAVGVQEVEQRREGVVGLASDDHVDAWESPERRNIHD